MEGTNPQLTQLKELIGQRSTLNLSDCDSMTLGAKASRETSESVMKELAIVNAQITALTSQGIGVGMTIRRTEICSCGHAHEVKLRADGQEQIDTGWY